MRKLFLLILLLPLIGNAQDKKKDNWGWRAITSVGMISGEQGTKELFQLSGGVTYSRFYLGAGAAYDPYIIRSIPIFADIRFDYLKSRAAFVYVNLGVSKPIDEEQNPFGASFSINESKGKFYYDIGTGYRIHLGGIHNLAFSAGYSQKRIIHEEGWETPCGIVPCSEPMTTTYVYDYKFGRVMVKLAWEFGK